MRMQVLHESSAFAVLMLCIMENEQKFCASLCFVRFWCGKRHSIAFFHLFYICTRALAPWTLSDIALTLKYSVIIKSPLVFSVFFSHNELIFDVFWYGKCHIKLIWSIPMIDMSNMQTRMKKTCAKSTFSNKDPRSSQSIHYAILTQ